MRLTVRYSETFEETFKAVVLFIDGKWGETTTNKFIKKAEGVIEKIAKFPQMYKAIQFDNNIRKAPINKLSSLYYQVTDTHIILLYIVDNRQEPFWD